MNQTIREADGARLVAWFVVLVLAGLLLGSVAAAGWQSGTAATVGLHADAAAMLHPNGELIAPDGNANIGSEVAGRPADSEAAGTDLTALGPGKRDNRTNESRSANGIGEPSGSNGTDFTGSTASTDTGSTETNDTPTTTHATAEHVRAANETDRIAEEKRVRNKCGAGKATMATEPRTDARSSVSDHDDETHPALRTRLWIIEALVVLTTLFSLGGFVAAVMAYRGTD